MLHFDNKKPNKSCMKKLNDWPTVKNRLQNSSSIK